MELHRGRLIDHIQLRCGDLAASKHFYATVLAVLGRELVELAPGLIVADPCELILGTLNIVPGTAGASMSRKGSMMAGLPVCGEEFTPFTWTKPPPFQAPTTSVRALPVVLIVDPPTIFKAVALLEFTKTPHPVVTLVVPVVLSAPLADGSRVMMQPPELASRAPVVARAVTLAVGNPNTAENS